MTSEQYSNTPVKLDRLCQVYGKFWKEQTFNNHPYNREHDQDTGLHFRIAPYPDRNPVTVITYQDNIEMHHLFDQNKPDVRLMTEDIVFTMTAKFEILPGLATWLPSRTFAAIHQVHKATR